MTSMDTCGLGRCEGLLRNISFSVKYHKTYRASIMGSLRMRRATWVVVLLLIVTPFSQGVAVDSRQKRLNTNEINDGAEKRPDISHPKKQKTSLLPLDHPKAGQTTLIDDEFAGFSVYGDALSAVALGLQPMQKLSADYSDDIAYLSESDAPRYYFDVSSQIRDEEIIDDDSALSDHEYDRVIDEENAEFVDEDLLNTLEFTYDDGLAENVGKGAQRAMANKPLIKQKVQVEEEVNLSAEDSGCDADEAKQNGLVRRCAKSNTIDPFVMVAKEEQKMTPLLKFTGAAFVVLFIALALYVTTTVLPSVRKIPRQTLDATETETLSTAKEAVV